jgi:hypothetical protein
MGHRPAHEAPGRDDDPAPEPYGLDFAPRFNGDRGLAAAARKPRLADGGAPGGAARRRAGPEGRGCVGGRRGPYGWSMSMWRLTAAAIAARSPSSELTIRSPRRRAPSTTLASTMSAARARPARTPVALALVSSRPSTSHPASSRASCAWRDVPRQHWAMTEAGTVGTTRRSSKARCRTHIGRSPRSAAISAPES